MAIIEALEIIHNLTEKSQITPERRNRIHTLAKQALKAIAPLMEEHEKMRGRMIELEEIHGDKGEPLTWRGSGEPLAKKANNKMNDLLDYRINKLVTHPRLSQLQPLWYRIALGKLQEQLRRRNNAVDIKRWEEMKVQMFEKGQKWEGFSDNDKAMYTRLEGYRRCFKSNGDAN